MSNNSSDPGQLHTSYNSCQQVGPGCPVEATTYGYYPVLSVNIFFAVFYGICLLIQIPIAIRTKTWTYAIGLGIGTLLEFLGYVGRILMHYNPWNQSAFEMQICCLVLAPSFIAASLYLTLKHMVKHYGVEFSRLRPKWYPWIFVGCDFGSIVLQAIGGGVAASGGSSDNEATAKAGDDLIVAGIAFQVATMVVCGVLVVDYVYRMREERRSDIQSSTATKAVSNTSTNTTPNDSEEERGERHVAAQTTGQQSTKASMLLDTFWGGLVFAYTTILIRCIYRLPEMIGGWGNPRMRKETEFLILDGMMIALAVLSLTIVHPGYCFPQMRNHRHSKKQQHQEQQQSQLHRNERPHSTISTSTSSSTPSIVAAVDPEKKI